MGDATLFDQGIQKWAEINGCWRYQLGRLWNDNDVHTSILGFIMLNPSTADASQDDPTITRCMKRARLLGYDGIVVANLFALRSTDPKALKTHPDPVGPVNDFWLFKTLDSCNDVVAAWGTHGTLNDRDKQVLALINKWGFGLSCLGEPTKDGHPRHPLYVGYDVPLREFHA